MKKRIVGIYGLGRFGSFWASLFARHPELFTVYGCNRTPRNQHIEGVTIVEPEELKYVDALFICVAISSFEEVLRRLADIVRPGTVVFDTCSVKWYPAEIMKTVLPDSVYSIATHPMFGPDSAKNGVAGLPMVFWPLNCPAEEAEYWETVFSDMKMRLTALSPEEHDREAALTQGITHVIGRVLGEMELKPSPIATKGYSKLLDIVEQTCNDPYQLFMDLQHFNPYTHNMRRQLKQSLEKTMQVLSRADPIQEDDAADEPGGRVFREMLQRMKNGGRNDEGKHG